MKYNCKGECPPLEGAKGVDLILLLYFIFQCNQLEHDFLIESRTIPFRYSRDRLSKGGILRIDSP